jgi:hypothetical protein
MTDEELWEEIRNEARQANTQLREIANKAKEHYDKQDQPYPPHLRNLIDYLSAQGDPAELLLAIETATPGNRLAACRNASGRNARDPQPAAKPEQRGEQP